VFLILSQRVTGYRTEFCIYRCARRTSH